MLLLSHLRTLNNIWVTISNSHTDRPTTCNVNLGRVAGHFLQIARFTIRKLLALQLADSQLTNTQLGDSQLADSKLACLRFRITLFF